MSNLSYLPLFTGDYIRDTRHLTLEEQGAYLNLMMFAWQTPTCSLPADDTFLARTLGITAKRWAGLKTRVMAFWTLVDGAWHQRRLTHERKFVDSKIEKRRAAGALGGRPKLLKNIDETKAKGSENQNQTQSEPKAPIAIPTLALSSASAPAPQDPAKRFMDAIFAAVPRMRQDMASRAGLLDTSTVTRWLVSGADLELDVIPAVVGVLNRQPNFTPSGWAYFEKAIAEYRQKRLASPLAAVTPPEPPKSRLDENGRLRPSSRGEVYIIHRYRNGDTEHLNPNEYTAIVKWHEFIDRWKATGKWNREDLGPAPDEPHCVVPEHILNPQQIERKPFDPLWDEDLPETQFGMAH